MRYLFATSIAVNLLLLAGIVLARVDPLRQTDVTDGPYWVTLERPEQPVDWPEQPVDWPEQPVEPIRSFDGLIGRLVGSGFAPTDVKTLAVGWLEANLVQKRTNRPAFWQSEFSPLTKSLRQRLEAEEAMRQVLLTFFGPAAATDPAFARAFRPLGQEYDFLSADSELALQRHQLAVIDSRGPNPAVSFQCSAPVSGAGPSVPDLPEEWSESETREYRVRFSPTADALRRSWDASDEAAFRAVFAKLDEIQGSSTPDIQSQVRGQLRRLMGNAAFERFWAIRDPFYPVLRDYLSRAGATGAQVSSAYSIVTHAQESVLRSIPLSGQMADLPALASIERREMAALRQLLGDELAAGLHAARDRSILELGTRGAF